jgi:hypothetical protein
MYENVRNDFKKTLLDIGISFDLAFNEAYNKFGHSQAKIERYLNELIKGYNILGMPPRKLSSIKY